MAAQSEPYAKHVRFKNKAAALEGFRTLIGNFTSTGESTRLSPQEGIADELPRPFRKSSKRPDPGRLVLKSSVGADRVVYPRLAPQPRWGQRLARHGLPEGCAPLNAREALALDVLKELQGEDVVEHDGTGFSVRVLVHDIDLSSQVCSASRRRPAGS